MTDYRKILENDQQRYYQEFDDPKKAERYILFRVNALLIKYGQNWPPRPLSRDVKLRPERHCYHNAYSLALECRFTYVEGYAGHLEHAWCVDRYGKVVDPTWPKDLRIGIDYFGIAFNIDWISSKIFEYHKRTRRYIYGVIFNIVLDNPALIASPDEMLSPRWNDLSILRGLVGGNEKY